MKSPIYPQFFDLKRIGESLQEVSSDVLRVESQDLVGRWFHAADEVDLFLWIDAKKAVVKQQLSFYGQVVEWNSVEGLKTGVIIEEELPDEPSGPVKPAEVIRFDEKPQVQPLNLAKDLIAKTVALTKGEQDEIIRNFSGIAKRKSGGAFAQLFKKWFSK